MNCPYCHAPLVEGDKFCANCGQPVQSAPRMQQAIPPVGEEKNSSLLLIVLILIAVVLCCGAAVVGGYFLLSNQKQVELAPLTEEDPALAGLQATVSAQETAIAAQMTEQQEQPTQQVQEAAPQEEVSPNSPDIIEGGLHFWFDETLMQGVSAVTVDPVPPGDYVPWEFSPMHLSLEVQNPKGVIHFVPVGAYLTMGDFASETINELQFTLENRPGVASWGCIPTWDFPCEHQQMNINVSYFDFQNGSGIRSVTVYAPQNTSGINNQSIDYYYNGLTENGQFYVYANFDLSHTALSEDDYNVPDEVMLDMTGDKLREFVISYGDMLESSPNGYQPQLEILDAVVKSLRVEIKH